ncbi:hypothetical protein NMG60_11018955 [Bertholletia excelsa]
MKHYAVQQQNAFAAYEEMRREAVVCPKPRRLGLLNPGVSDPVRPLRRILAVDYSINSHHAGLGESDAGTGLLDIILPKGGNGADQFCAQVASSPPFFCGSPPSRVSNPVIQDARFGDEKFTPISPRSIPVPSGLPASSSPATSGRKGGCVRASFGNNPAVRIEGFDCLDRDRRSCSIPALA